MSISQENEFGDKNNLEISLKRALFGADFFDIWNQPNRFEILTVYHDMQYQKKLMTKTRENEFGNKK